MADGARLYRRPHAAKYLGMSVFLFDRDVRPRLTEIPLGKGGVAFDRLDLDAWADHVKQANGRPPERIPGAPAGTET